MRIRIFFTSTKLPLLPLRQFPFYNDQYEETLREGVIGVKDTGRSAKRPGAVVPAWLEITNICMCVVQGGYQGFQTAELHMFIKIRRSSRTRVVPTC